NKRGDVDRISTSVFITNFPMSTSAKELFQACKQYGHVVDSFIPNKKSKNGKRFGFVKFINVFSEERLVNNLCTVWIDRYKLHANIARFQRSQAKRDGDGGVLKVMETIRSRFFNGADQSEKKLHGSLGIRF
nr:nucleotide-binding alpha-beta plait domain-containing protein [Tanacetum cinerariifolium]